VPRIVLDFDPPQPDAPVFTFDTGDIVFFLSWAFSTRYGASHELSIAATLMRAEFKIDMQPLLTFADRNVEDPADEEALERAWQDAAPLAECCERVQEALASDEKRLASLRDEYPALRDGIRELGQIAAWTASHGARIRVTYELEDEP
jgi:predicted dehydrogenase